MGKHTNPNPQGGAPSRRPVITADQEKQLAAALGIDPGAVGAGLDWLEALRKLSAAARWLADLIDQFVPAAKGAQGAAAHDPALHAACCSCLEAARHAITSAEVSLACACECCEGH